MRDMFGQLAVYAHGQADLCRDVQDVREALYIVSVEPSSGRAAEADGNLSNMCQNEKYLSVLLA